MKTNIPFYMKLDEESKKRLDELSEKSNLNKSEIMRRLIMDAKIIEQPPADWRKAIKMWSGLCNNFNQIAVHLNTTGYIDIDELAKERMEVVKMVKDVREMYL